MQLEKTGANEVTTSVGIDGVISAKVKYKMTSPEARIEWTGPKISREVWDAILSFFKWSNTTHKSESQVRLYVNPVIKEWGVWAFPQKGGTGMTSEEIERTETAEEVQARFLYWGEEAPNGNWIYFGTVHHHCNGSAFQSGTDAANERHQDGIHITVGKLDKDVHDIHCRLCVAGYECNPRMDRFFQVDEYLQDILPDDKLDDIARAMMCVTCPANTSFPDIWKDNYVVVERKPIIYGGTGVYTAGELDYRAGQPSHWRKSWMERCDDAVDAILESAETNHMSWQHLDGLMTMCSTDATVIGSIFAALKNNRLDIDDICRYWPNSEHEATSQRAGREAKRQQEKDKERAAPATEEKKSKKGKKKDEETAAEANGTTTLGIHGLTAQELQELREQGYGCAE